MCKSVAAGESTPQTAERSTITADRIRADEGTVDEKDETLVDLTPGLVEPSNPPVVVDRHDTLLSWKSYPA
jgi:hypothetical protein